VGAQAGSSRAVDADLTGDLVRRVRVGRQGVYDARRQLVAYRATFSVGTAAGTVPQQRADHTPRDVDQPPTTTQAVAAAFGTFGVDVLTDGKPLFARLPRPFVTGIVPLPAEPGALVVDLGQHTFADAELLAGLARLRRDGYRVSLTDHTGDAARAALAEVADFVALPVATLPPLVVPGLVAACRARGVTLVASGVEDAATFAHCLELGFDLFEGRYLQRPMLLERRVLTPSQLVCARLLGELADPDLSVARIEHLVGSDPGLTLRVLRTANSVATGSVAELSSLRQALVLLGPRRLRSWVVLALLDGGTSRDVSDDLWAVLARAHACQRLAAVHPDLAFTIGLLSGAADLLGAAAADVADGAGLGAEGRSALLDGDGDAGRALVAVLAHERDDVEGVTRTGLTPVDVSHAYLESLRESLDIVHDLQGD
jgi:EAL and modified HD-GYP domain-containing signal transduction protein